MSQTLPPKPNHKVNYFEKLYHQLLTHSRVKTLRFYKNVEYLMQLE